MPVHIETNEIRAFKAVHDQGGFKKAADSLFVTQSAVSQTISNLEKKLDCVLLERNPLKLTEAGIRLLNYAEAVLGEEQAVLDDIRNIQHGILSTLHLAISGSINQLYGEQLMLAYCQNSPLTRIKLNVLPSRQIINAIATDLWELGFGPFQQKMPENFQTLPLFQDERALMIHQDHPVLDSSDPEQALREVPLIVSHLDDPDMRPTLDKMRDNFGSIWEINDIELRTSLVAAGKAMSFLDEGLVEANPKLSKLTVLDRLPFARIPLTFGLFHRKGKVLSSGANKFIEVCNSFSFRERHSGREPFSM